MLWYVQLDEFYTRILPKQPEQRLNKIRCSNYSRICFSSGQIIFPWYSHCLKEWSSTSHFEKCPVNSVNWSSITVYSHGILMIFPLFWEKPWTNQPKNKDLDSSTVSTSASRRAFCISKLSNCLLLLGVTLWWTNILPWKITIFNGKIHYFYGHFQLLCWFTRG